MTFHCPNCNVELAVMRANGVQQQPAPQMYQPSNGAGGLWCPIHGTPAVMKPAGYRKDGTPYNAFPVCSDPSCRARPARQNAPQPVSTGPYAPQNGGVAPSATDELP